eukprot:TRINITY_DN1541_c0_g1_i10.p2 TRINITY_DN1541_c0_g1~~TRINITY_DN1541_c0_g1_i10.p2  ORF type:complete len:119 (-),score=12.29 TRINITY_DN1541_c0_g1_i10:117-473(-)
MKIKFLAFCLFALFCWSVCANEDATSESLGNWEAQEYSSELLAYLNSVQFRADCDKSFTQYDADRNGYLNKTEYANFMNSLFTANPDFPAPTSAEINAFFSTAAGSDGVCLRLHTPRK